MASAHPMQAGIGYVTQIQGTVTPSRDHQDTTQQTPPSPQTDVHSWQGVIIEVQTPSSTPDSPASDAVAEAPQGLPDSVMLDKVPVGKQTRPLNCEFQSASDLAWYYGYPYTWKEIFDQVGHDPNGNPHVGFVGRSFDDPPGRLYPQGYGVYAEPIAAGLKKIGVNAQVHYGESETWLKEQVAGGNPVMVWVTAGMVVRPPEYWTAKDGRRIKAVRGEHTNLVIGYNEQGVWVADPWDGRRHHYAWPVFLASWDILDRMSLVITNSETPSP